MRTKYGRIAGLGLAAMVVVAAALAQNHGTGTAAGGRMVIGLVPTPAPARAGGAGADLSAPLRQRLVDQLHGAGFDVVPLESSDGPQLDAEAGARHASYLLYTRVEQKHAGGLSGIGGMLRKLSPLAGALPMMGGRGGGLAGAASSMAQGAASASAASAQQQAMSAMSGGQPSAMDIKSGDTVSIEYRLVAVGSSANLSSATLQGKARGDGEDVLSPLVGQLASSVSAAAHPGAPVAAATQASYQQPAQPQADDASHARHSMLGGLFGRHDATATKTVANAGTPAMDCASMASMPNAPMTLESCQKLQAVQQSYNQAANDPGAARPGDEQMSCEQITAELRQQQIAAPDKAKVAAAQQTSAEQQVMLKREIANTQKMQAEDQAAVNAASAADRATELATGGLVQGRALQATEKTLDARHRANNERVVKEEAPVASKSIGQMADLGSDMAQQFQSNPRLARLVQLANAKRCKGG